MKNRFLRLAAYLMVLYCIETLLCIFCYETEYLVKALRGHYDWGYKQALRDAIEWNIFRMLAFYAITLVVLYWGLKRPWQKRTLQVAVFNCGIYLLLSVVCWLLLPGEITGWFKYLPFYLGPATFLSPFIAQRIYRVPALLHPAS